MNNPFPVEYSTLSSQHLLQLIKSSYNFESNLTICYIKRGFNDTYLLESNSRKFILRVYKHNWKNIDEVKTEMLLLTYLNENGVSVSYPILDCQKKYIQTIYAPEGIRYAVLFSFAEGVQIKKLSNHQTFLLGAQTGKMHQLTLNKNFGETAFTYTFESILHKADATIKPLLENYPEQYNYFLSLKDEFFNEWKNLNLSDIGIGICHGDLQAENFHISPANQITLFDFDFLGNGFLLYDIGVFMWYDHKNKPKEIIKSFLEGYQTERKLTETEIEILPYFGTLRAIFQIDLFCHISNGSTLPLWPSEQVANFITKINTWHLAQKKMFK